MSTISPSTVEVAYAGLLRFPGLNLANGKVNIGGSGDSKLSWTTREDTARFMGYAFTHLTTSELSGKALRIEGDKLVSIFQHRTMRQPI